MISKVATTDLKIGMFVADLDRPWTDTPFLIQGFLIDNDKQILALRKHCQYVVVDRARSTGKEYAPPPKVEVKSSLRVPAHRTATVATEVKPATAQTVHVQTTPHATGTFMSTKSMSYLGIGVVDIDAERALLIASRFILVMSEVEELREQLGLTKPRLLH